MKSWHSVHYQKMICTSRWQRTRAAIMARDSHLCQDCKAAGIVRAAAEVHHIRPVDWSGFAAERERLMFDPANLVSLCSPCHRERHRQIGSTSRKAQAERDAKRDAMAYEDLFGVDPRG